MCLPSESRHELLWYDVLVARRKISIHNIFSRLCIERLHLLNSNLGIWIHGSTSEVEILAIVVILPKKKLCSFSKIESVPLSLTSL